jgi:hypothetical protein
VPTKFASNNLGGERSCSTCAVSRIPLCRANGGAERGRIDLRRPQRGRIDPTTQEQVRLGPCPHSKSAGARSA